jgi:hypothetical protein
LLPARHKASDVPAAALGPYPVPLLPLNAPFDIEKCFYKQIFAVNLPRLCKFSEQFKTAHTRRQKPQSPV